MQRTLYPITLASLAPPKPRITAQEAVMEQYRRIYVARYGHDYVANYEAYLDTLDKKGDGGRPLNDDDQEDAE